jgi:primary-amine oxidase
VTSHLVHPLDPLTPAEFAATTATLRSAGHVTDSFRFAAIELIEPAKVDVLAFTAGERDAASLGRRARAIVWDRATNVTHEGVVDLAADPPSVLSFDAVPGVTPNFTVDEWHECDEILRAHPDVQAALATRGITDMELVLIDVWTYGKPLMPPQYDDRRLGWCDVWTRNSPTANPYANPVSGLHLLVDMNTMELLEVEDSFVAEPQPVMGEYDPELVPGMTLREVKPLEITQPDGPGFTLDGYELRWQNWSMRLGFNYREGPVLFQVAYDGRPVAYRMSFAEMVVPYRDPTVDHYRRTAYDIGEWGLGVMTTSLELGCDCLGEIVYVDAALTDSKGEPYTITNAICLHEEDNAVLWKHVDGVTGAQVRRQRRMVVSCHVTVANYEYLVYWRFYQDGNIECEVRATGIMVTTPIPEGQDSSPYGTTVDVRTYAPFHQHFLVARLDLDVDGTDNSVLEVDTVVPPMDESNPYGLAVTTRSTLVASEAEAARDFDWHTQRGWKVVNPSRTNASGLTCGYKLVPGACFPALMDPASPQFQRFPVVGHQLWVTAHHDDERWPCGDYPTQSADDQGMTRWVADDEPLENTDVVLWYVFGIHHITRPEEWPIMPVDAISFWLKPFGFFDRNPSLDVPPNPPAHCHPEHHHDVAHGAHGAAPHH